jgi:hypothetical protein
MGVLARRGRDHHHSGPPLRPTTTAQPAIPLLAGVLERYDERQTRESAHYTSWLAEPQVQAGDLEHAAALAERTLEWASSTSSSRGDDRVALLTRRLEPHRAVGAIRESLDREASGAPVSREVRQLYRGGTARCPGNGWAQQDSNLRPLACKSWADRVPQCARGVPPRRIFGRDVGPAAVVLGSLLHGCYMVGTLPTGCQTSSSPSCPSYHRCSAADLMTPEPPGRRLRRNAAVRVRLWSMPGGDSGVVERQPHGLQVGLQVETAPALRRPGPAVTSWCAGRAGPGASPPSPGPPSWPPCAPSP